MKIMAEYGCAEQPIPGAGRATNKAEEGRRDGKKSTKVLRRLRDVEFLKTSARKL